MQDSKKISRRLGADTQPKVNGETLRRWMTIFAALIRDAEARLTELDAAIGDGDHGANMRRGMNAVEEKLDALALADFSGQARIISNTMMTAVGGASGPLYGAFFLQCSHSTVHKPELGLTDLAAAIEAGCRGVVQLGKAAVNDKTMVDSITAAVNSLRSSAAHHESLVEALRACQRSCRLAAEATAPMQARKGRASYLGERSMGTQDPGATSASLLFDALAQAVLPLSAPNNLNKTKLILL